MRLHRFLFFVFIISWISCGEDRDLNCEELLSGPLSVSESEPKCFASWNVPKPIFELWSRVRSSKAVMNSMSHLSDSEDERECLFKAYIILGYYSLEGFPIGMSNRDFEYLRKVLFSDLVKK